MMDSNLMTAKRREANPRTQAKPRTTKTMRDIDPAGFSNEPLTLAAGIFDDKYKTVIEKKLR
jgi:hypothetical protein